MPQFLNRLLALPIDEQNVLFAALEARIEANIASAIEAGTFNLGVETVRAESLTVVRAGNRLRPSRNPLRDAKSPRSSAETVWNRFFPTTRSGYTDSTPRRNPSWSSTHARTARPSFFPPRFASSTTATYSSATG